MADKPATALQPEADPSGWVDDHGDYLFRYAVFRLGHAEAADSESTGMVSRRSDPASGARAWAASAEQTAFVLTFRGKSVAPRQSE
jgi:hypothetical protein